MYGAEQGVVVAYHPHVACTVETEEEIDTLMGQTQQLKLCLDVSHIALVEEDPLEHLEKYRDRLGYLHLKDWAKGKFVELGEGSLGIDFPAFLKRLDEQQYPAWIVVEQSRSDLSPLHSAQVNADYLAGFGLFVGDEHMTLALGLCGCGGMARRHLLGLKKLQEIGKLEFDLVGVGDPVQGQGEGVADLAHDLFGRRPQVFAGFASLHRTLPHLDALDITSSPDTHVAIGLEAFAAGVHVMVEKPIALTVPQGLQLVQAAAEANRKLAVAENYRRDPINRLAKALIEKGALGQVFLAVQFSSGSGERVVITPWRHQKESGGIVLDMGVHYTDLLEFYLGPIESVVGMNRTVDHRRVDTNGTWHPVSAEDLTVGVARFESGAIANLLLNLAGRGESQFSRMMYGTGGSLSIPPDRTGRPLKLMQRRNGEDITVAEEEHLALVPDFTLDETTAELFGGDRLTSYTLPWSDIDANLLAVEYDDFAQAILTGRDPEVSGQRRLALAGTDVRLSRVRTGRALYAHRRTVERRARFPINKKFSRRGRLTDVALGVPHGFRRRASARLFGNPQRRKQAAGHAARRRRRPLVRRC